MTDGLHAAPPLLSVRDIAFKPKLSHLRRMHLGVGCVGAVADHRPAERSAILAPPFAAVYLPRSCHRAPHRRGAARPDCVYHFGNEQAHIAAREVGMVRYMTSSLSNSNRGPLIAYACRNRTHR